MAVPRVVIGLILFFTVYVGFAGDPVYPAYLIPDSLKINANAVIRYSEVNLEISDHAHATYSEFLALTVLNARGDEHAQFIGFYDKLRKISAISITTYDAFGNRIENVRNKDIQDVSAISGFSLYEDNRVRYYKPTVNRYPYTVVIKYQINYNGYLQFPYWQPQVASDIAIEKAVFNLNMPATHPVKCMSRNMMQSPVEKLSGQLQSYTWELNQVQAFQPEFLQPYMKEVLPVVHVAPLKFSLDGFNGNMQSWKDFGLWINQLLDGQNNLPEESQEKIRKLVSETTDTLQMIELIYNYVQDHTRYVSIQLGIGGFQPFEAETVDRVGYGDCKALTHYTKTLLEAAGIHSLYTLVRAGNNAGCVLTEFPSQQFNHVILAVPLKKDTIWLECTDQNMPFNYLGQFTDNRYALAVTERGGVLVKTKQYPPEFNSIHSFANIHLDENGNGSAEFNVCYEGLEYDNIHAFVHSDAESQRKWLYKQLYIPNAEVINHSIKKHHEVRPHAELTVNFNLEKYGIKSGKRMFVTLNPVDAFPDIPSKETKRKFDIVLRQSYLHTDTLVFHLPEGYEVEYQPSRVELASDFGEFSSSVELASNKVIYRRYLKVLEGRYHSSDYSDFFDFYKTVIKADKAKLVLTSGF